MFLAENLENFGLPEAEPGRAGCLIPIANSNRGVAPKPEFSTTFQR
jgi:hypothetical protein